MSAAVDIEQAHRLREAETRWLRQCADRLRAAHVRAETPARERVEEER